jgi:regulator of nonsense transcripts 2
MIYAMAKIKMVIACCPHFFLIPIFTHTAGLDKSAAMNHSRPDKSGNNRSGQRARKLQLSDVDWYDPNKSSLNPFENSSHPKIKNETIVRKRNCNPTVPLADREFLPAVTPRKSFGQSLIAKPARMIGNGTLSRREILKEHASRNAALKIDPRK